MRDDVLDALTDENVKALIDAVNAVGRYGLSDDLVEALMLLRMVSRLMNDQMIHDVSRALAAAFKVIDALEGSAALDAVLRALQDPGLEASMGSREAGMYELIKAMGDPSFRKGLAVLVELIKAVGRAADAYKLARSEESR